MWIFQTRRSDWNRNGNIGFNHTNLANWWDICISQAKKAQINVINFFLLYVPQNNQQNSSIKKLNNVFQQRNTYLASINVKKNTLESFYAPGANLAFTFPKLNLFYFCKMSPNLFIILSIAYKHNLLVLVY